jgi:hypothetical protein
MASLSKYHFYIGIDGISLFFVVLTTFLIPICILVGRSSIKSYKREYMIAFLICESFMIVVFCMLDLLLFYVFFESILIPMLCGAEHLIFAGRSTASAGALCSKPFRAYLNWVVPAKLLEKGSLMCKHSILVELVGWPIWDWGGYSEWVPCKTSPRLLEYCMNMQKRVLLGRGKWSFAARKKNSSSSRSADTLAWITDDDYRGGREEHCTRHLRMDVNLLATY